MRNKRKIISYCGYCHNPIYEGDGMTIRNGVPYHYDPNNPLESCFFSDEETNEEEEI